MAYSINNYNIASASGIVAGDTEEQWFTKISAWLNTLNIGTAEVYNMTETRNAVRWYPYGNTGVAFLFGHISTNTSSSYDKYWGLGFEYLDNGSPTVCNLSNSETVRINDCTIHITKTDTDFSIKFTYCVGVGKANQIYTISYLSYNNSDKKVAIVRAATNNYTVQVENESSVRTYNRDYNELPSSNIYTTSRTMLNRFIVPYTDCAVDNAYWVTGVVPEQGVIFELDRHKYTVVYNLSNNGCMALKLE